VSDRPSRTAPLVTRARTSSTGTHSIRSLSQRSTGSPTWVAPSAMNMWKIWSVVPLLGA
jgi:hypothetical protein